jgi:hypothetical protein
METQTPLSPKYYRITRDSEGVIQALETAIVRFGRSNSDPHGATVDLVGAIHLGERSYYDKLEQEFDQYDVVLYEGILPRKRQFLSMKDRNPFTMLNRALAHQLELEYQPDCINYRRANFEHADLLWREYRKSVRRRHEHSLLGLPVPVEMKQEGIDQQEFERLVDDAVANFFQRYLTAQPGLELRRTFVTELLEADSQAESALYSQSSTLLTERNQVALRALRREFERNKKRLAIFYGCAHMPDFESHLTNDFGMQRLEEQWLVAWDMSTMDTQKGTASHRL